MIFGIYPGSIAGDDRGGLASGPPDDADAILRAVTELQGSPSRPLLVRAYVAFTDDTDPSGRHPTITPGNAARYVDAGRTLDLVAQFQSRSGDVEGYGTFLGALVEQYGPVTSTLQVTEEPNVSGKPVLDGDYPRVPEAVTAGVSAAKDRARELGHDHLRVGFNTTPLFGPAEAFLADLAAAGGDRFRTDLDYVGLDFFPDVFSPIEPDKFAGAVTWLLRRHRHDLLEPAGLGAVPLHVTENGWPTGPDRSVARQADVVDAVVRTVADLEEELDLRAYVHFALRDADSARDTLFHRFGLLTDDYRPKPAFGTYAALIAELGDGLRTAT